MTGWQVIGMTGWQDDGITGIFADDWPYGIIYPCSLNESQFISHDKIPHVLLLPAVEVHLQPAAGGAGGVRPAVRGGHRPHPHLPRLQLQQLVLCSHIQQVSWQKSHTTIKNVWKLLRCNSNLIIIYDAVWKRFNFFSFAYTVNYLYLRIGKPLRV